MLNDFLKKISLYGIILFTVLITIWFMVFIIKQTMKYTIFGEFTESFFIVSIIALVSIIVALAIINISANLNIISESLKKTNAVKNYNFIKLIIITLISLILLFMIIGFSLHNINSFNSNKTANNIKLELNETITSNESIINELTDLIDKEQNITEISKLIRLIETSTPTIKNMEILYPKKINNKVVFLVINRWNSYSEKKYSNISNTIFVTKEKKEISYLNNYLKDNKTIDEMTFVSRPKITLYKPIYKNNNLKFIFYSDYNEIAGHYLKKY